MRVLMSELFLRVAAFGGADTHVHERHPHIREDHTTLLLSLHIQHPPSPIRNPPGYLRNANPGVPGGPPGWSTHGGGVLAQLHAAVPLPQGFISANCRVRDLGRCRPRVRAAQAFPTGSGPRFWGRSHCSGLSGALPHLTHTTGQLTSHTGPGSPRNPAEARGRLSSVRWGGLAGPNSCSSQPRSQVTLHFPTLDATRVGKHVSLL